MTRVSTTSHAAPANLVLAQFEEGLRGVIGLLDDPNVEVPAIERAVERLSQLFAELRATSGGGVALEADMRAPLDGALTRSAGLNAVAQQLVGRRLELVAEQIAVARHLQQALDRTCESDDTGGYCNVER